MPRLKSVLPLALLLQVVSVALHAETARDEAFFRELVATRYVEPFRSGDVDRWILAFDEAAIAMHNRRPMDRGRAAIEAFGRMVHKHLELREYEVEVTDIRQSRDWVYTVGRYTTHFVSREDGSAPFGREEGKFLLLWALQEDGDWKIILDTGNSNQ